MPLDLSSFDLNRIDAGFIENPHPLLHRLRAEKPNLSQRRRLGLPDAARRLSEGLPEPRDAVGQDRGLRREVRALPLHTHHTTSLIFNDPPYHTVVRRLISGAFTPRKPRSSSR